MGREDIGTGSFKDSRNSTVFLAKARATSVVQASFRDSGESALDV